MPLDLANYHRIALLLDVESIEDVIRWADEEIARSDAPAAALIEISMGQSKPIKLIEEHLRSLALDLNEPSSLHAVLMQVSARVRDGVLPVDQAIDRISNYARFYHGTNELRVAFLGLAEDLSCIRDGVSGTSDVSILRQPLLIILEDICTGKRPT